MAVRRRLWRYWPSWLVATALYATWYVTHGSGEGPGLALDVSTLVGIPRNYFEIASNGFTILLPGGSPVGTVVTMIVLAWVGVLLARRRTDSTQIILLGWSAVFVALVSVSRVAAGQASTNAVRYSYLVVLILLLVVVWSLPPREAGWELAIIVPLTIATLWVNIAEIDHRVRFWDVRSNESRLVVEAAGALVERGEPFEVTAGIDQPRAGRLMADGLAMLVADGWDPEPSGDANVEERARGMLRFAVRPSSDESAACSTVPEGVSTDISVSRIDVEVDEGERAILIFDDRFGRGIVELVGPVRRSVTPVSEQEARASLDAESGPIVVCGS
jgi:hypothetical protein